MSRMVRKQVYLEPRQEALLKRLARARGVSEAEVIRQAIEGQVGRGETPSPLADHVAWEQAYQFMRDLRARGPIAGQTRLWQREDLYDERVSRYGRDSH
jgi:hypothetical protein